MKNGGAYSCLFRIPEQANIGDPAPQGFLAPERDIFCLYNQLVSWDNLLLAFQDASRGKRRQPNAAAFEHQLEINLVQLQIELKELTYHPGNYTSFHIHEPKKRLISAAPFRDRVVHHALCNIIEPFFEPGFIFDSYANRKRKGTHKALNRCQYYARHYKYVLQCDIRQFFPSIDHEILKSIIMSKITDEKVMRLIKQILYSGVGILKDEFDMVYFQGDDLFAIERPRGLPIGNLTSQFWANVYMTPFDHFVKRELGCKAYIRYVDDFLLFDNDKQKLHLFLEKITERLTRYRLIIHKGAHPDPVTAGIPFLGFIVFPDKRRLKPRNGINFQRKMKRVIKLYFTGAMPLAKIITIVEGWVNHARYGNTARLRDSIFAQVEKVILKAENPLESEKLLTALKKIIAVKV